MASYFERIRDEADRLGADGCTFGSAAFRDCCREHDCHYRCGVTLDGEPITRDEADLRFRACMQNRSVLGWWSPMAHFRYWILKHFGQKAWDDNARSRAKEAERRARLAGQSGPPAL